MKITRDFYFIPNNSLAYIETVRAFENENEKFNPSLIDLFFKIRQVMINGDHTTVMWTDGSHTVVKRKPDEPDNFEVAILYAMLKKYCDGNGSAMTRYFQDAKEKTIVKEDKKGKED